MMYNFIKTNYNRYVGHRRWKVSPLIPTSIKCKDFEFSHLICNLKSNITVVTSDLLFIKHIHNTPMLGCCACQIHTQNMSISLLKPYNPSLQCIYKCNEIRYTYGSKICPITFCGNFGRKFCIQFIFNSGDVHYNAYIFQAQCIYGYTRKCYRKGKAGNIA